MDNKKNYNGLAIASLVLGILSLLFIFFGYGALLGILFGIAGIITGIMSRKESSSGMATAGIVMSIIGLAFCVVAFIACVACVASLSQYAIY